MQPQFQPPPPPPPPEPPTHGPLEIAIFPQGFSVRVGKRQLARLGYYRLFALPALIGLLIFLVLILIGDQFEGEPPWATLGLIWAALSALAAAWGLVTIFGANGASEKSELRFDAQRWSVTRRGREEPLQKFQRVRAHRRSQLVQFWALELVPHGAEKPLTVYGRFTPKQAPELAQSASWLAYMLRVPADIDGSLYSLDARGMNEKTAAMLCYLPIYGVFIATSLYYLFKGDRRPLVRFAARQSLVQSAFSFLVLIFVLALCGTPVALLDDGPVRVALIVLLCVLLGAYAIWNLVAHIIACTRANRGVPWIMPWLAPIVTRWHPSAHTQPR